MEEQRFHERRREDARLLELEKWRVFVDAQVGRLISDAESEKGTRARANILLSAELKEINARMSRIERTIYLAIGAVLAADYLFKMFVK